MPISNKKVQITKPSSELGYTDWMKKLYSLIGVITIFFAKIRAIIIFINIFCNRIERFFLIAIH